MFTCSTFLSLWQYCNTCMLSVIFLIQLMMYWPFLYSIILYSIPEHVFNVVVEMVNYFVMIFAINQSYKVCIYLKSQDNRNGVRYKGFYRIFIHLESSFTEVFLNISYLKNMESLLIGRTDCYNIYAINWAWK